MLIGTRRPRGERRAASNFLTRNGHPHPLLDPRKRDHEDALHLDRALCTRTPD